MSRVWGREETYQWPSDKPVWTITALALTVVAVLAAAFSLASIGHNPFTIHYDCLACPKIAKTAIRCSVSC